MPTILLGQSYWSFHADQDTVEVGFEYRAYIEIDVSKVKDINNVEVYCWKNLVERTGNKFPISFAIFLREPLKYDLTIVNKEKTPVDSIKLQKIVYGVKQKNPKPQTPLVLSPEEMPVFISFEEKTFDNYLIRELEKVDIQIQGKLILQYIILTDGRVSEIKVHGKSLNYIEKDQIAAIVSRTNWRAGKHKGKVVNVPMSNSYNFK